MKELEEELRETRQRLQATIEELESSNEELQSMNEELQTAREETQSINEELQTVNAELRSKVEALDRAHSDLQNLFRSTRIATIFLDRNLRIQRFTPPATDLFRLRDSDIGRSVRDITHRFTDGELEQDVEDVLETLVPRQREGRIEEEGRWYTLRISPYRTVDDVIEGVVLTFTDITRIKESEERLRRQSEFAQGIVDTVHDPLVVLGPDLRVLSAGRAFYEAFRLAPDEVEGRHFLDLHSGGWNLSEGRLQGVRRGEDVIRDVEVRVPVSDGDRRILRLSARPVVSPDGREPPSDRVLVTMQDVTDRRAWEEERMEEARRKDWFLTVLGHELRNPLAPLTTGLDLLRDGEAGDETEILATMDRAARHLRRLVDDLLDLSRVRSGAIPFHRERVDLTRLVREAVEDQRRDLEDAGRELAVTLEEGPIWVDADEARIHQSIDNLLNNALRFTSPGDRITIELARDATGPTAAVTVRDTGMGMTEEALEQAFEAFRGTAGGPERRDRGIGIGLTLVKEVMEGHGGTAEAASAGPGEGARFTLRLPVEGAPGAPEDGPERPEAVADGPDRRLRILMVEDDEMVAGMTRRFLEAEGHEVTTERDGEEAVRTALEVRPDVVLCDLGLPGEMDGYDVAEALRSADGLADVRLVVITGYGQAADRERSFDAGFDAFLVKPFQAGELRRTLDELFAAEDAG